MCVCALSACGRVGFDHAGTGSIDAATDGSNNMEMALAWKAFSPAPPTTADLYSVWAFAENDVWIAGSDGDLYQFDGTSWSARSGPTEDVYQLWGASATELWEVGRLCNVSRWTGMAWTPVTVPGCASTSYFAVHGLSANDFWIGGAGGDLRHVVGGTFMLVPQANNIDLWSVWPVSATETYFTGTRGTILRWNGTTMLDESMGGSVTISAMWGTAGDLWIVGTGGLIYRKLGAGAWTQVASPTTSFLYWVFGTSPTDIWAIGDAGVALHYGGEDWKLVTMPATTTLRSITRVPGGGLRMVGHGGTVLRLP